MADKRYDQFTTGSPAGSRITLHADPTTGSLEKCSLSDILALQNNQSFIINKIQALGSDIKGTVLGFNPFGISSGLGINATIAWINFVPTLPGLITGAWYTLGPQGSFTASNFNGLALYTHGTSSFTQVAITANSATCWNNASGTIIKIPFTSPYTTTDGLLWLAYLFNYSAIAQTPTLGATPFVQQNATSILDFTNSVPAYGYITSQSTLASSYNYSSVQKFTQLLPMMGLY